MYNTCRHTYIHTYTHTYSTQHVEKGPKKLQNTKLHSKPKTPQPDCLRFKKLPSSLWVLGGVGILGL